jgi:hypothetical protein
LRLLRDLMAIRRKGAGKLACIHLFKANDDYLCHDTALPYVNWSSPEHAAYAQAVFRERLFDYLQKYLSEGNTALIDYQDKSKPVHMAEEFRSLLAAKPSLSELVPAFYENLADYPAAPLSGVEDFLYWSIENFGFKPVTSVTHVIIFRQSGFAAIASKQIYVSHYFDASLGLTFVLDDPDSQGPCTWRT